jgi:hypothetical protein
VGEPEASEPVGVAEALGARDGESAVTGCGVARGDVVAVSQPARIAAIEAAPSNRESVALVRRIIDYPDRPKARGQPIGRGCNGFAEHGLPPACVSNARRREFPGREFPLISRTTCNPGGPAALCL